MITLRNKLYESLLDDEENLIDDNKAIREIQFYEECEKMLPRSREDYIKRSCEYNNGKLKLDSFYVGSEYRTPDEYGDNIFKGFSVSSDIEYIKEILILKWSSTKKIDPNKYSISKINKYPMHIKKLKLFEIYTPHLLDYCENIKIDEIVNMNFYLGDYYPGEGVPFPTPTNFEFFKCVKKIEYANFSDLGTLSNYTIIPSGTIKNINAKQLDIHLRQIVPDATEKSDLTEENKQIFDKFIDELHKYNNIEQIILTTHSKKPYREKKYIVEKGKSKKSNYLLKPI